MSDQNTTIEAGKSALIPDVLHRLVLEGVDPDTAELKMGYIRKSLPLLGDVRAVAVIAIDEDGRVGEVVHMPHDDLDPIVLDEAIIVDVLRGITDVTLGYASTEQGAHEIAHKIVDALRAGTTKESR